MRLIDADALNPKFVHGRWDDRYVPEKEVQDAPTVDAVEVVRCEDCKHSDWYESADGQKRCYCMANYSNGLTENDYCSKGERSE